MSSSPPRASAAGHPAHGDDTIGSARRGLLPEPNSQHKIVSGYGVPTWVLSMTGPDSLAAARVGVNSGPGQVLGARCFAT